MLEIVISYAVLNSNDLYDISQVQDKCLEFFLLLLLKHAQRYSSLESVPGVGLGPQRPLFNFKSLC